mmetsp:Transcript_105622/g.336314  ORF Transcript_105622/g.336314 Transcript_105622/m.336314 type:complete len:340 (-) Transcript_105622:274-1293(-)
MHMCDHPKPFSANGVPLTVAVGGVTGILLRGHGGQLDGQELGERLGRHVADDILLARVVVGVRLLVRRLADQRVWVGVPAEANAGVEWVDVVALPEHHAHGSGVIQRPPVPRHVKKHLHALQALLLVGSERVLHPQGAWVAVVEPARLNAVLVASGDCLEDVQHVRCRARPGVRNGDQPLRLVRDVEQVQGQRVEPPGPRGDLRQGAMGDGDRRGGELEDGEAQAVERVVEGGGPKADQDEGGRRDLCTRSAIVLLDPQQLLQVGLPEDPRLFRFVTVELAVGAIEDAAPERGAHAARIPRDVGQTVPLRLEVLRLRHAVVVLNLVLVLLVVLVVPLAF